MEVKMLNDTLNLNNEKNPRIALYKKPIRKDNLRLEVSDTYVLQEVRRQRLLEIQKSRRDIALNTARGILNEILNLDDECEEKMEVDRSYYPESHQPYALFSSERHKYANQLMMSEWMLEVPQDFSKWIMVPCPRGKRTLIVACKKSTKAYSRRGCRLLEKFHSALPGGNPDEHHSHYCILDGLWLKEQKTFYILDVLAWSNQPLLNCDAEFRFFWLESKFQEMNEVRERGTQRNTYPILPLPIISCELNLYQELVDLPKLPPLDGILFYHRNGQYTKGCTPLVTWLKTFMLPEILGVSVPPPLDETPPNYVDIESYFFDIKRRKEEKMNSNNFMEIVDENP